MSNSLASIKVFGLTGSIACGKSTAAKVIAKQNIPIIDGDQVARDIVVPESVGLAQVAEAFGQDVLLDNGTLDRNKLGSIVFSNPSKMDLLNAIMIPLIESHVDFLTSMYRSAGVKLACFDAALIIENNHVHKFRPLIVVSCSPETQLQRLMKRNSLSEEEAKQRINAQLSSLEKEKHADFIIRTDNSLEETEKEVLEVLKKIKEGN